MGFTTLLMATSTTIMLLAPQELVNSMKDPQVVEGVTVETQTQIETEEAIRTQAPEIPETESETPVLPETETEKITEKDYSQVQPESDLWLLAHVVSGEAHACDRTEMEYVASVVMNRVKSDRFPNTVSEVVYQTDPIQYACVYDGSGNFQQEPTIDNWEEAEYILNMYNEEGYTVLPDDVVWQSQEPQGVGTYTKTDYHYYCY